MRFSMLMMALPLVALAPADSARGGMQNMIVAEIVTFKIIDEMNDEAFLDAAKGTQAIVSAAPGFISPTCPKVRMAYGRIISCGKI